MIELLDLIARWVHVIAGIMWIGNSMLFNWLDRSLRPSADPDAYGEIWLLHSGGFYDVQKNRGTRTSRDPQPVALHWFKWQAYTTWLSGAALLIVVYYVGGRALMVDPAVADISPRAGAFIGVGAIAVAWVLYETIWRTLGSRAPRVAGALSVVLLVVAIELILARLSGRAAYVHVGAMLGTLMAGNVVFTIMPSQRDLVDALQAGREPSQEIADRAKTRSIHNNYITFPVIVLMMSAHFPSLYAGARADLALLTLIAGGAAVRHVLNVRFTFRHWKPVLAGVLAASALLLAAEVQAGPFRRTSPATVAPPSGTVSFDEVRRVIDRRCVPCHSTSPSDVSLGAMPAGVAFDTPQQIQSLAARIRERAVATRTMPPGNKTRMTDEERALLAHWLDRAASIP